MRETLLYELIENICSKERESCEQNIHGAFVEIVKAERLYLKR